MLPIKILKEVFKKSKFKLTPADFKSAQNKATKLKKELEEVLISENLIDETELYEKAGDLLGFPFISLKGKEIRKEVLELIPSPLASTHQVVAFEKDKEELKLAMTDPTDIKTIEFLRRKTGMEPKVYITTTSDLREALRHYHTGLEEDLRIIQDQTGELNTKDLKKAAEELPIVNIVNSILEHAVFENASDIHLEPLEKEITVRYRIDGILKPVMTLPKQIQNGIVARIKILANLKLDEHMVPQDGRFKIQIQEERVAFRVSIIPVYD